MPYYNYYYSISKVNSIILKKHPVRGYRSRAALGIAFLKGRIERTRLQVQLAIMSTLLAVLGILLSPSQSLPSEVWKNDGLSQSSLANIKQTCSTTSTNTTDEGNTCWFGYYCLNRMCQCRKAPHRIVECTSDNVSYNFAVLNCYCATFNQKKSLLQVGYCIWNCSTASESLNARVSGVYRILTNLPSDYNMCQPLKRTGTLCGKCLPNHYPLTYSYNFKCVKCHHIRWDLVRYVLAAYFPLTLFYLVVLFLKLNIVSSHLHPVVLFSQAMSMPPLARALLLSTPKRYLPSAKVLLSVYGMWNLDFFRPYYSDLCLGIGILPTLALDYAIAVYPLLLMMISYLLITLYDRNYRVITIMWKPFRTLLSLFGRNWDIKTSIIDAFSAFFLLTNTKFLSVTFDLLVPTRVYHLYGDSYNYTLRLFYSADIEYFGREHLPYGILAIVALCVFVILPIAILALYPFAFFQKFLNLFPVRWYILHTFVDSFQGCYKDGTEPGTRDCRWFSAVYLAFRVISFLLYGITQNGSYFIFCSMVSLFGILLIIAFQPYKNRVIRHFQSNTIFYILYVMFYASLTAQERAAFEASDSYSSFTSLFCVVIALVPLVSILGLLLYWLFSRYQFCLKLFCQRRGYVALGDGDGDDADAYCDRVVNPQAYPAIPSSHN